MRVLVTGGTGVLGREFVVRLLKAGYAVRVLSRRGPWPKENSQVEWGQGDLETGMGLAQAVQHADVILHAATSPFRSTQSVDVRGTEQLLKHARAAGTSHFVYVSIVGIDRIPLGYYRHKLAAEALVRQADVPWSILRATQFHTLLDGLLQRLEWLPILPLPIDFLFQPIDPGEVADRLIDCVAVGPGGCLPDVGGPEVRSLGDLAQTWMEARRIKRWLIHLPTPGKVAAGYRHGHNTAPQQKYGRLTWGEWLRGKYAQPQV